MDGAFCSVRFNFKIAGLLQNFSPFGRDKFNGDTTTFSS